MNSEDERYFFKLKQRINFSFNDSCFTLLVEHIFDIMRCRDMKDKSGDLNVNLTTSCIIPVATKEDGSMDRMRICEDSFIDRFPLRSRVNDKNHIKLWGKLFGRKIDGGWNDGRKYKMRTWSFYVSRCFRYASFLFLTSGSEVKGLGWEKNSLEFILLDSIFNFNCFD